MEEGPKQLSQEAEGDRVGSRENRSEGDRSQHLLLGRRHVPLVPEFNISTGVTALGPKFVWKTHPSAHCTSVPGHLPWDYVVRQLRCICRTILNLQAVPVEPECLVKTGYITS